jgi:nitroimidazol reductase NimA-like FMN-containing flavoprotein (pyridoxamine 5'-phosphate oxidase superfamily)
MKYEVRRKDRQIDSEQALAIVDKAAFGTMAFASGGAGDAADDPYCAVLSLAREGEWLYLHGAKTGRKTDCMRANPRVCISFVGDVSYPADNFTTVYESAIVFGTAEEVLDDDEKIRALRLICERWTPANMAAFDAEIAKSLAHTAIWKIHIDEITGKRRKPPQ